MYLSHFALIYCLSQLEDNIQFKITLIDTNNKERVISVNEKFFE